MMPTPSTARLLKMRRLRLRRHRWGVKDPLQLGDGRLCEVVAPDAITREGAGPRLQPTGLSSRSLAQPLQDAANLRG